MFCAEVRYSWPLRGGGKNTEADKSNGRNVSWPRSRDAETRETQVAKKNKGGRQQIEGATGGTATTPAEEVAGEEERGAVWSIRERM